MPQIPDRRCITGLRRLAAAGAIAAGLGIAGCGGNAATTGSESDHHTTRAHSSAGISSTARRAATRRLARKLGVSAARVKRLKGGRGLAATSVRPGEIVPGGPGPFFSSDVIWPIRNGWQASDHRSYTAVDAGVDPADHSVGELGIFRQNFIEATQTQDVVDVPGAGALKITDAPLGNDVATWAQKRGNLRFVGKRGVRGTLHLRNDKVTINDS
jgi:hypothetical protein